MRLTGVQRMFLIVYFLLFTYCCIWVPWSVKVQSPSGPSGSYRFGYGWLWAGPDISGHDFGGKSNWVVLATPDVPAIVLRIAALTAVSLAVITATSLVKPTMFGRAHFQHSYKST